MPGVLNSKVAQFEKQQALEEQTIEQVEVELLRLQNKALRELYNESLERLANTEFERKILQIRIAELEGKFNGSSRA